jgi:hypothetical protein
MNRITTVGLDADDTLWHKGGVFVQNPCGVRVSGGSMSADVGANPVNIARTGRKLRR